MALPPISRVARFALPLLLAAACPLSALAQAGNGPVYAGLTVGVAAIASSNDDLSLHEAKVSRPSWGAFVGVTLTTLPVARGWPLSVELGYQELARVRATYDWQGGRTRVDHDGAAVYVAAKVDMPLSERFSLYGRLGVSSSDVTTTVVSGNYPSETTGRRTSAMPGFGLEFRINPGLSLRGELTGYRYGSSTPNAAALNFGIAQRF